MIQSNVLKSHTLTSAHQITQTNLCIGFRQIWRDYYIDNAIKKQMKRKKKRKGSIKIGFWRNRLAFVCQIEKLQQQQIELHRIAKYIRFTNARCMNMNKKSAERNIYFRQVRHSYWRFTFEFRIIFTHWQHIYQINQNLDLIVIFRTRMTLFSWIVWMNFMM